MMRTPLWLFAPFSLGSIVLAPVLVAGLLFLTPPCQAQDEAQPDAVGLTSPEVAARYVQILRERARKGATPGALSQLASQVQKLREAQQDEQVVEIVEDRWLDLVTAGPEQGNAIGAPRASVLWTYFEVLEQQAEAGGPQLKARNRASLITSLQRALTEIPAVFDDRGDWIYSKLIDELIEARRLDEAVQWAKRRYVLCAFDAGALERAARVVERVLALKDPTYASHQAWIQAQRNPASAVANPLTAIALPTADPQINKAIREFLQSRASQKHSLISVLLVEGRNREAMEAALDVLLANKGAVDGPREVSRVFKGVDLHLKRANAFVGFFKVVGEENPLPGFLAENQAKEAKPEARQTEEAAPAVLAPVRFTGDEVVGLAGRGAPVPPQVSESAVVAPFMTLMLALRTGTVSLEELGVPVPPRVSESIVIAPFMTSLAAVRSGTVSPQELWKKGVLTADDVLPALSSWFPQKERIALVELLVKNAPDRLESIEKSPANVRLAVADYFRSVGDARAEPLLLGILSEIKEPQSEGVLALALLGSWYEESGQFAKAATTYERAERYSTKRFWIGDLLVHAARAYRRAGEAQKAAAVYARVPNYGYGWATMLSYYDQAQPLMAMGKLAEAQALLSQPAYPPGVTASNDSNSASAFLAQNAWLAEVAYQQGHLEEALRYGQEAKRLGENTKSLFPESQPLYALGRDIYNRAGGWKTQAIQTEVKRLVLNIPASSPDRPVYKRFRVKTYGDTTIMATVGHPAVQVSVLPLRNWHRSGLNTQEYQAEVIVRASATQPAADVPLVLIIPARGETMTLRLSLVREPS